MAAAHLPERLAALEEFQQVPERLAAEDDALATFLGEHYSGRKHVDHIQATLMIFRRKRALARLQAAESALRLAQELLAPDPLIPRLVELLQAGPGPVALAEIDREQLTGSPRLLDEQITLVKDRLREIQATLGQGNGWIDIQYVHRERVRPIVVQYIIALNKQRDDGTPVPAELEREIDPELAAVIQARQEIPKRLEPLVYETVWHMTTIRSFLCHLCYSCIFYLNYLLLLRRASIDESLSYAYILGNSPEQGRTMK